MTIAGPPSAKRAIGGTLVPYLAACLGIALYSVMDAVMKGLALTIGAYSALFWRLAAGLVVTGGVWLASRAPWPSARVLRIHAGRGAVVAAMALAFFWGIVRVPLAEAIALSFIAPVIALGLAAAVLKERIAPRALFASAIGVGGVGVILAGQLGRAHPPEAAWGAAAVLVSACFYAVNLVMARHQAQLARPIEIACFQQAFVLGCLAPGATWLVRLPPAILWPAIALAAALAIVSLLLLSWANARAEAQLLVSVEHTAFVWAAIMGWLVFGEPLRATTVAGAVLIVGACLVATRGRGAPGLPEAEALG